MSDLQHELALQQQAYIELAEHNARLQNELEAERRKVGRLKRAMYAIAENFPEADEYIGLVLSGRLDAAEPPAASGETSQDGEGPL